MADWLAGASVCTRAQRGAEGWKFLILACMAERIPVDVDIAAFWAKGHGALRDAGIQPPYAAILPDYDNWNDYGRRFLAKLLLATAEGETLKLDLRTMVEGRRVTSVFMDALFEANGPVVPIGDAGRAFVSQLMEPEAYRSLIAHLGFEGGVAALRAIGDAVVARMEGEDGQRLELAGSEDFHVGVLRNPSAYEASIKGARFIRPEPAPAVDEAARSFLLISALPCADNPYVVPFDFEADEMLQDRINVLIGRNGTGKTLALRALLGRFTDGGIPEDVSRRTLLVRRPVVSRVIVFASSATNQYPAQIAPWRGIDYDYQPLTAPPVEGPDPLLASLLAAVRGDPSFSFTIDGQIYDRGDLLREAIAPLGIWAQIHVPMLPPTADDRIGGLELAEGRYHPLHRRLDELGTVQLGRQVDWDRPVILIDGGGGRRQLSSGEQVMLRFAAQATLSIEKGSLLLLDEPETHLHPNFISDLMEMLHNLLSATGSIAIIATHSAYVVREVPRRRVNIFSVADRGVDVGPPRLQTFGASIDTISQFVFGDTNFAHRYQRALREWVEREGAALGLDAIIERHGADLNRESLSFIAQLLAERGVPDRAE